MKKLITPFNNLIRSNFSSLLTQSQKRYYNENGYLVLEKAVSDSSINKLLERTDQIIQDSDIVAKQIFFKADNKEKRAANFLETASTISFLLEEGSLNENNQLKHSDKKLALNKIAHAMHDLDPVYEEFSYNQTFLDVLSGIGLEDPVLVQSMFIFKNKKVGTKVEMHADNSYIISEPRLSCVGLWVALGDATRENGCLYGFPGSHKNATEYFMVRDGVSTSYQGVEPNYKQKYNPEQAACLEVPKGSLVVLHGDFVHFSGDNHSDISRPAYTMHFYDQSNGNHWSNKSWLQRVPQLPFRRYIDVVKQKQC